MSHKMQIELDEQSNYPGSKMFASLANAAGLSVDLTNFLIVQGSALLLASVFRSFLSPTKTSASARHAYGLIIGLLFSYFCFGQQAIHIAGLPAVCYVIMLTQNPLFVQRIVMVAALTYLSCIHLHRQWNDYGSYTIDITGPLMIITQKVVSLAFAIHDGFVSSKKSRELTKSQQYHMIEKVPSPLEYFGYMLNFQTLMAGPLIFYRDYNEFIEGYNFIGKSSSIGKNDETMKKIVQEPSPVKTVVKKVIASLICAYIFVKFINVYPMSNIKDDAFLSSHGILYIFWYITMWTTVVRFKYYFAWTLADAIINNAGLGFNGYDTDGSPKWDLFTNIRIMSIELGTNMRDCISSWNLGTNIWLRMVVYERVHKKYSTILTFALSAFWHGFYPGYYMTFSTGALITAASRKARHMIRYRFQKTEFSRNFYDALTCLVTRFVLSYTTTPFVLLEFGASYRLYLKLFMCLHFAAAIFAFVLPKFIRGSSDRTIPPKSASVPVKETSGCMEDNIAQTNNFQCVTKNDDSLTVSDEQADTKPKSSDSVDESSSSSNAVSNSTHPRNIDTNFLLKDLINKEVSKIKGETDNFSNLLMEKIEAANIEGLIDATVSGIVELKDDLMRMNEPEVYSGNATEGLRKRNVEDSTSIASDSVDMFLKKEIDAIKEANVIPAVLSNGHAK